MIKAIKKFFCWMAWHSYFVGYDDVRHPSWDPLKFLLIAKCKWCDFEGNIDSQGNLY